MAVPYFVDHFIFQTADVIKFINAQTGSTPASFYLIGFSLGAHVSGYVGELLRNPKLARITGKSLKQTHVVVGNFHKKE